MWIDFLFLCFENISICLPGISDKDDLFQGNNVDNSTSSEASSLLGLHQPSAGLSRVVPAPPLPPLQPYPPLTHTGREG